jgi:hypothetical protein
VGPAEDEVEDHRVSIGYPIDLAVRKLASQNPVTAGSNFTCVLEVSILPASTRPA